MIKSSSVELENIDIGLKQSEISEITNNLSRVLAANYFLYHKSLYYHWNVKGREFVSLHALFEEIYQKLHKNGDVIAERIRVLGFITPGRYKDFLELSFISEDENLPSSSDNMVSNLIKDNEMMVKECRKIIDVTSKAFDEVSTDLIVSIMSDHENMAWKLRSIIC